jgi:FkbM family methyltransferase
MSTAVHPPATEEKTVRPFVVEFSTVLLHNLFNEHTDNHDSYRFGPAKPVSRPSGLKAYLKIKLRSRGYQNTPAVIGPTINQVTQHSALLGHFEYLYNLLADDYSRRLLVKVCAFRILGKTKIKLPMNSPAYWETIARIERDIASKEDFIQTGFRGDWKLFRHDLRPLGYEVELYLRSIGVYYDFLYKGYAYNQGEVKIEAVEGDHVIDAGGCYGDTALFFAHQAGKNGKVHSLEFVDDNIAILTRNTKLNPELEKRIDLVPNPLWSTEGVPVYYESNGPATKVSMDRISEKSKMVPTVTIDGLVESGRIAKVDFLKMDIEGAEVEALKGAELTLRTFRPRLAICLYHRPSDFETIPKFIDSLGLGYRFYFNHYTIHAEESVLFCIT